MKGKKTQDYIEWKVGRDAYTGMLIPIEEARRRKKTATVETMRRKR